MTVKLAATGKIIWSNKDALSFIEMMTIISVIHLSDYDLQSPAKM